MSDEETEPTPQPSPNRLKYGDLPREEVMAMANRSLKPNTEVYFKFTCESCGERCVFAEPNVLYETGECGKCGKITNVTEAGFMLVITMNPPKKSAIPFAPAKKGGPDGPH